MKPKGFEPAQPRIPGVPHEYAPATAHTPKGAAPVPKSATSAKPAKTDPKQSKLVAGQPVYVWAAAGGGVLLVLIIVIVWWALGSSKAAPPAPAPVATAPAPPPPVQAPAPKLPIAPGQVATTEELPHAWDAKKFLFRNSDGDTTPSVLVRLPGDKYWAISLREPYGTCEMDYVKDLAELQSVYNLKASHPMVADPCTKAVYDLGSYGTGPNGLVRGAVVAGTAIRPPLAIEVEVHGNAIFATQSEK